MITFFKFKLFINFKTTLEKYVAETFSIGFSELPCPGKSKLITLNLLVSILYKAEKSFELCPIACKQNLASTFVFVSNL